MKPILWLRAIRDHRPKPGPRSARYSVTLMLALRMNRDGAGFASVRQLAEDAGISQTTVRRHITWARDTGHLIRTRRGQRRGDGTTVASEYQLSEPSSGEQLSDVSTVQIDGLNRPASGAPEVCNPEVPGPSIRLPTGSEPVAPEKWIWTEPLADDVAADAAYAAAPRECVKCGRPWARDADVSDDKLCQECRDEATDG